MSFSLNKMMIIGNLGKDAEHRTTNSGAIASSFTVATTSSFKTKEGNWENETTWHNVVAWNLSDFFKEALKKGRKVYVEGRIVKREYTDKDNIKRYVTEVISSQIIPLDAQGQVSGGRSFDSPSVSYGGNQNIPAEQDMPTQPDEDLPF